GRSSARSSGRAALRSTARFWRPSGALGMNDELRAMRQAFDKESNFLMEVLRLENLGLNRVNRGRFRQMLYCVNVIALSIERAEAAATGCTQSPAAGATVNVKANGKRRSRPRCSPATDSRRKAKRNRDNRLPETVRTS